MSANEEKIRRQMAIEAGWDPEVLDISDELNHELTNAVVNAVKKINNQKVGSPEAAAAISMVICGVWSGWLVQLPPLERAKSFEQGTSYVSNELMDFRRSELDANTSI